MSSFDTQYHQYHQYPYQEAPQINTDYFFEYGSSDVSGSKSPSSLINHTGYSPGPLTGYSPKPLSTPPLSRNASQGPESFPEQAPEQMVYDGSSGSLSNSPTSVRTPDHDSFEFEMLDGEMRDFYQSQSTIMTSTHATQSTIPAMEAPMFAYSNQGMFPSDLQFHQQTQFTMQSRPLQADIPPQSYQTFYGQSYTDQPPRQDPWSGQGPLRNPNIPRSGVVVFDPVTDPYAAFSSMNDTTSWTANNTDPNYLVSPNDPVAPPQDFFSVATQDFLPSQSRQQAQYHMPNHMHIERDNPIQMRLTAASPPPGPQTFVNYNATSPLFTDTYTTEHHPRPTLITSIEMPNSPIPLASSPGGSDSMMSSSYSDQGINNSPHETRFMASTSPIEVARSPARSIPEVTFEISSPEPEGHMPGPIRRSRDQAKNMSRPGGRALGTHLEPKVAKAAHDMRKTVACWHCVLQRDKCGPGDICERCFKRAQRPNADCGLGCSRTKLIELAHYFLPSLVMQIHEDTNLMRFVSQFISQWNNKELVIYMTCSQKNMPHLPVKVYEFSPLGKELLEQIQYRTDPRTQQRIAVVKQSPPLGMVHINYNEEKKYDNYVSDIVDHHIDSFAEICWAEDDNDFAPRLFKLMTRVKLKNEDENKLVREVYRLIVTTYIMSHTLTMVEKYKKRTLQELHSPIPIDQYSDFTSPRMTNRQLKYFFARLQRSILATVLNKLQQIMKSSKGCDKWVAAFICVVGLCMAHEDQQKTVHQVMATRAATENMDMRDAQTQAEFACREIDSRMNFISQIFRYKYNRKCNPLKDPDHEWEKEVGFGDESSALFVRNVAQLVKENTDYLQQRQSISISASNQGKYTARLISQFVLSFWLPQ
ncbi:hypothetical protein DM02DRAFT_708049 [Periconia macrospinosa]|uniref:Uncharacterized protein n=1 Tax=Periconia macrospinosa TaxID=97972 RepID=A0A2V1DQJ1_9PLEO|nr:hypothetical protein DM02DRAFT_708049 [Periconia macrospinosa]